MTEVAYRDGRYFVDGSPLFVIGAEVQYYRLRRETWRERLIQLRDAHVNTITCYVPWRHHLLPGSTEPPLRYDFDGRTRPRRDLRAFLSLCEELGLWIIAKPGPFVHSELAIGGLPDLVCPDHDPRIEPVRRHDRSPLRWTYDGKALPSPEDPRFDALARDWLEAVGRVLEPHAVPRGRLIGVQLNDETLYCSSNAPPWELGYEIRPGPRPGDEPASERDLAAYVEWADFQWRLRRDSYARYATYLGLDLPRLTNFAGIAPPIEENVPAADSGALDLPSPAYARLYPEWWLAHHRIDADRAVYHYGCISWLGVAAYGIEKPNDLRRTDGEARFEVFARYVDTARRRRGLNLEENWGFARLYHPWSACPIVPVFQTLASLAGGCTGYVAFCPIRHDEWDDDLDPVTRKISPTFPSAAGILPDGTTTPLHDAMVRLNAWLAAEGRTLLRCEPHRQVCWLVYPPYAAISSWTPEERIAGLPAPRCGAGGFVPFSRRAQAHGYAHGLLELDAAPLGELLAWPVCAMRLGFFMDRGCQERLLAYARGGGKLLLAGPLPDRELDGKSCTVLRDALRGTLTPIGRGVIRHEPDAGFFTGDGLVAALERFGLRPSARAHAELRAAVHEGGTDRFVWFFSFTSRRRLHAWVELDDGRVDLLLGPRSCGVVHLREGRIVSALLKGHNEVEDVSVEVEVRFGEDRVAGVGDVLVLPDDPPARAPTTSP